MKVEIKHRHTGSVLFSLETSSVKLCLEAAVKNGANLEGADLGGADLWGANLGGANLRGAKNVPPLALAQMSILPAGGIVGWKKLRDDLIAQLFIPSDTARVNAYGSRKCRAAFAYVTAIFKGTSNEVVAEGYGIHNSKFRYAIGLVTPDSFDPNPQQECSHGIHFFITRVEAEAYS